MKRVLLTGGSGFIGKNLARQLRESCELDAPSHAELDLLDEDAVARRLDEGRYDAVIHAATHDATATSTKDPGRVVAANCRMYFNLARRSEACGKLLHFGSGAELDRRHWKPRMAESDFDAHVPLDDYGFSKYVIARDSESRRNVWNLRLFGVFGPGEDWRLRFISHACCRALCDLPITIRRNAFFDYLWIEDLAPIVVWFLEHDSPHKTVNVCTGHSEELLSIAGRVLAASGKSLPIVVAAPGLGPECGGDNSRLRSLFPDMRFSSHDETIPRLYRWYEAQRELIDRNTLLASE